MFAGGSSGAGTASFYLNRRARCLVALEGDTDHNKFVVGTLDLAGNNELHVLDFNEDTNEVVSQRAFKHEHEIWGIATCPAPEHTELVCTTYAEPRQVHNGEMRASLWRMDGLDEAAVAAEGAAPREAPPAVPMTELLQLGDPVPLREHVGVIWNAVLPEQVCALMRNRLVLHTLAHGATASSATESASCPNPLEDGYDLHVASAPPGFGCGRWDPHHAHTLGVGLDNSVVTIDTRSMKVAHAIKPAHRQQVQTIDFNPNKPCVGGHYICRAARRSGPGGSARLTAGGGRSCVGTTSCRPAATTGSSTGTCASRGRTTSCSMCRRTVTGSAPRSTSAAAGTWRRGDV